MNLTASATDTVLLAGNLPGRFAGTASPDKILTESEFYNLTNTRPRTVQRWRVTGEGPVFLRIGPRRVGYRLSDVEDWLAQRTFKHRAAELAQSTAA